MKVITFATLKGGAGKTMNCFNIGGILAEKKKVLFIDVDPQCNLSYNCGVDITDRSKPTIKDVYERSSKEQPLPDEIVIKAPIKELPNLDIIPASIFLFRSEREIFLKADRERIFEKYFQKNRIFFEGYDYILIDTNPSMSFTNINAFLVANEIVLSCDISNNSLTGADLFCELWDEQREALNKEDNISSLIISNYDGRSNIAKDLIEFTNSSSSFKDIVQKTIIGATAKLKETEVIHKPINVCYPKHKACEQYRELIKEMKKGGTL